MYLQIRKQAIWMFLIVMLISLSGCGGAQGTQEIKEESSEAKVAETKLVSTVTKQKTLVDYKTGGEYDPAKIFTDINSKPKKHQYPSNLKGNVEKGRKIFSNTKTGNCAACHCTDDSAGCGDIGVSLKGYRGKLGKSKKKTDEWLYQVIADRRAFQKSTVMPPSLETKVLNEQDIVDIVAYLNSLR